jgi:hypothetical protein
MKKIICLSMACIIMLQSFGNMPAPEYWDENNTDLFIKGHDNFPDYTFYYLIRSEWEDEEGPEALQLDQQYLRLSHYKKQKVYLWAELNENGLATDTVLISDNEVENADDHFILISGINDNSIEFERDFDKMAIPVRPEYPGGNNKQILIIISTSGILLLSLLAYLFRKRKSGSTFA